MDIGATKMETPQQFLQETPAQSAGGSAPTLANTCSNIPLDDARTVAVETTPNPLSYWPPPSSALPLINSSKDEMDGPQNQVSTLNHYAEPLKNSNDRISQNSDETPVVSKCSEVTHSLDNSSPTTPSQPTKILHHNLPPIAGITSSHNYRGVREIHKHSQTNTSETLKPIAKSGPEKQETVESESNVEGCEKNENKESKEVTEDKPNTVSDKTKTDDSNDVEILEVPITSSADRSKTANSEHVFSIPAALTTASISKSMPSPRAPTPFVHSSGSSPVPASSSVTEPPTLGVNSSSNSTTGSPSPSSRTAPSPQFIAPSPTPTGIPSFQCPSPSSRKASSPHFIAPSPTAPGMSGSMQCPSPSDGSRVSSSPSNLHRVLSSSHLKMGGVGSPNDGSRMLSSPHSGRHPQNTPPPSVPPQRMGSLPYAPNSHPNFGYLNTPKNNISEPFVHNYPTDSGRIRSGNDSTEGDKVYKDLSRQSQMNQNFRVNFPPKTSVSSPSQTQTSSSQRIEQPSDSQICRNPFELPLSKPYMQQYPQHNHHHQHHYQHLQQQQQQQQQQQPSSMKLSHYPNNVRNTSDSHPKLDHYMNMQQNIKEQQRLLGNTFHSPGFKPLSPRMNSEKELERLNDSQYKSMMNSQPSNLSKGSYSLPQPQNDNSVQRKTPNSLRNEAPQRDYPKPSDMTGNKSNGANAVGNAMWNNPEISEIGNKSAYLSAQNVNKTVNKVNGNEFVNRRIPDSGYPVKQGMHLPEGFVGRYNVNNGEKSTSSFSPINQINSLSQRFPPVPQSNYDLNRQIYDTMTGGTRAVQPPVSKPLDKNPPQFTKEQTIINPLSSKTKTYYPEYADEEKRKNFIQNIPVKPNDYSGQPRNPPPRPSQEYRSSSYGQFNNMIDKISHDVRPSVSQPSVNPPFQPQVQATELRASQPGSMLDHHKSGTHGFTSKVTTNHHISQSSCSTTTIDRSRPTYSHSKRFMFMPKHDQNLSEFESKNMEDTRPKGNSPHYPNLPTPQPTISGQPKSRHLPPPPTTSLRSKRESPLDLSVKTVRQSADSTAKDDGEVYVQNIRNFLQPTRSDARYPVSQSNDGATGAPKIDFTPNFSGFHAETQHSMSPSQPLHHKPDGPVLPPVESFKKFPARLPTPMPPDPKIRLGFSSPKYFPSQIMSNQKPQSSTADQTSNRYPHSDHFKLETLKRPSNDSTITHSSQPKIPKIDPWKVAFDQQIEQRLNSARINHQNSQSIERPLNGMDAPKSSTASSQYSSMYQTSRHSSNNYKGANMYPRPPVQTSATPYNPSYVQQPQCQPATPQTPQDKLQNRDNMGHSPDPEQIIKQISKGVMPDHKLLQDKNVLSILRSSLEEKEAKLMQLREAARRKEKYKELMTSEVNRKQFQPFEQPIKNQTQSKQNLPPFGALTLERMCAPPSFPGHKLNMPRSVDTVKIDIEPTQKYFSPAVKNEAEKSGIPNVNMSPQDDAQGPPTDLDGLAAFLAARIRTKGELKQVGPALEPGRPVLGQQIKTQPGSAATFNEVAERGLASSYHSQTSILSSGGSPPKLVRESRLLPPMRRRLFSHNEEETPTTSGVQNDERSRVPPRDPNGIRSSSETSVFDFRESDSEGEMPVLERQTLEGMRRDRKTFGSKQNVSTTTPEEVMEVDKPDVIQELDKSHPDPFWDTAFDMFVEQLEKRPPKRSVRKKKVFSRIPTIEDEKEETEKGTTEDSIDKTKNCSSTVDEEPKIKHEETDKKDVMEIKKEPEEKDKVETTQDGHVKLSSSRLKNYRDDMMKEDKLKEIKKEESKEDVKDDKPSNKEIEKEIEKPKESETTKKEKEEEKPKKEDGKVSKRGKSKISEKDAVIVDYESDYEDRELKSDSESTFEDDDDSLSLSGLESESSDSESSQESTNSNSSSYDDSETETVSKKKMGMQTRLQTRSSRQRQVKGTGMKLRSKPVPLPKATAKPARKRKKRKEEFYSSGKKKKPSFGDGSDFRPGWEEECYKFKQQLRMPEKLISISRPPKRSSASLPDLDPYRNSPSLDSADICLNKQSESKKAAPESEDSDTDASRKKFKGGEALTDSDNTTGSLLKLRNGKKAQSNSIINLLVKKYGKGNLKKQKELKAMNERKSPRILPKATNKPELLPTPSLGIGKENVLKDKKRNKDLNRKKLEENDSVYLGYFRRKTVNNFKEAFKQKVGLLPQEFSPVILKSRTRTQTRDMKKIATLVEVFGEERPASAPPLSREEDVSTDQERVEKSPEKKKPKVVKKVCGGVVTRGRGKLKRSGRPGLRSTAVLRSNKAVQISKRHLNSGRKRNIELLRIRAMASKKFSYLVTSSEASNQLPITKKRLKLRSVRRKFRSGFDYIRKKKKLKKDGDSADGSVKEKRLPSRPTSESVEDIQNEIKTWVINKGLGETILHRAARLGYTDIAAYCLEKMDCSPSPRDNAGYTPLHEACSRGHLEIAKLLLMYGASVSESAKGGIRPLHEAAENGYTELIRLLLSYGADPLLETYTGHTALSLVTDEEARRLIQHHLADVQGNVAPAWTFLGPSSLFDPQESGYDPLSDPPSPHPAQSDYELEISDVILPPLYRLASEPDRYWVLMRDLLLHTKSKSKDVILKQMGFPICKEMKLTEFNEQAKCCNFLGLGEKALTKACKVILVPYDEKVRQLLSVETAVV